MSNFSLDWFKSKKAKEKEALLVEQQKLQNELLKKQIDKIGEEADLKPYLNIKLVNDTLTVVLQDGSIISKPEATPDDFQKARSCYTEAALLEVVLCEEVKKDSDDKRIEESRVRNLQAGLGALEMLEDFVVKDNTVYFAESNRSIPALLVEKFLSIIGSLGLPPEEAQQALDVHDEYQSLKRFFMWCCLNPRAEVADQLYNFLQKNSFRITRQGFFVALRNVVTISKLDTELVKYISNTYNKVRAVWNKPPQNYEIYEVDGIYCEIENSSGCNYMTGEKLGNLKELYEALPDMAENRFTDAHTRTFDIRVGRVVNMPPEECSWSTADCMHAGLHFTADEINYVGCGDTSVLILINPMKVVGIGATKGRCYEYLPIMTVSREESTKILHDLDFNTLTLDEEYAVQELEGLAERVKEGFSKEVKKYSFNIPSISPLEINTIVHSLEEMKNSLKNRVKVVD